MTNRYNERFTSEWAELQKRFVEFSNATAKETLNAAADLLKVLSKELGSLGEQMNRWADATHKKAEETPPKQDQESKV
jgi:hypothetical protein